MGSFQRVVGVKENNLPDSYITAIKLFVESVYGAKEIDAVDLEAAKAENKFSMFFYMANVTIDRLLEDIREQVPSKCPELRVYGEEKKKYKKSNRKNDDENTYGYNERLE